MRWGRSAAGRSRGALGGRRPGFEGLESRRLLSTNPMSSGDGPIVTGLVRFGVHAMPTTIVLSFNEPLAVGPAQATFNYRILTPGARVINIDSAVYDPAAITVTLHPHRRVNVHQPYTLIAFGAPATGITDTAGRFLDGARTGMPGSDFVATLNRHTLAVNAFVPSATSAFQLTRDVLGQDAPRHQGA